MSGPGNAANGQPDARVARSKANRQAKVPSDENSASATKKISVFLSHKHEHRDIAELIKKRLEELAPRTVSVFISEQINPGAQWLDEIKNTLASADILLFLYADPSLNYDWCFMEVGLYMDVWGATKRPVLCLHPANGDRPGPLSDLQAVPTSREGIQSFLTKFFHDDAYIGRSEPINDKADINKLTEEIQKQMRPAAKTSDYPHRGMVIELQNPDQISFLQEQEAIPDDARVTQIDRDTLRDIFALGSKDDGWYWIDLCERMRERGSVAWLEELGRACSDASRWGLNVNLHSTLRAYSGAKLFRPTLFRFDHFEQERVHFHLLFTEERLPGSLGGEGRMAQLARILHMAHRFRLEVVKPYQGKMAEVAGGNREARSLFCARLREAYSLVVADATNQGLITEEALSHPFVAEEDKQRLASLLRTWEAEIDGALRRALTEEDVTEAERHLNQLAECHYEFVSICARRYSELAQEDLVSITGGAGKELDTC